MQHGEGERMEKLSHGIMRVALQLAAQLPDDPDEAIQVLRITEEVVKQFFVAARR
jgi:hypothetical protein